MQEQKTDYSAVIVQQNSQIISLMRQLVEQGQKKTDSEIIAEIRQESPATFQKVAKARIELADLGEVVETAAELAGKTLEQFCNPHGEAMRQAMLEVELAKNEKEAIDSANAAERRRLLEAASRL
jgi:hypothetical protein